MDSQQGTHTARKRDQSAGQAIVDTQHEWRWSAGYKAVTAAWTESVEEAEQTMARAIIEHIESMEGAGETVIAAIVARLEEREPERMCEIAPSEMGTGDTAQEQAAETLVRALCAGEHMRAAYVAAVDELISEYDGTPIAA